LISQTDVAISGTTAGQAAASLRKKKEAPAIANTSLKAGSGHLPRAPDINIHRITHREAGNPL